jgi:hypothetical protein
VYRDRAKAVAAAGPSIAAPSLAAPNHMHSTAPAYMDLANQYGLEDMDFEVADDEDEQTLEQEYQSYVTGKLSKPGTNILGYWGVSDSDNIY